MAILNIPKKLLDELNAAEMYLLSIVAGQIKRGNGFPDVKTLCRLTKWSDRKVKKYLSTLVSKGKMSVHFYSDKYAFSKLNNGYKSGCVCCGTHKRLHKHHYPIRKVDGGKSTVLMCESHHFEFHKMTDYGVYELIEKL